MMTSIDLNGVPAPIFLPNPKDNRLEAIRQIARDTFKEFALMAGAGAITVLFIATPAKVYLYVAAIGCAVTINLFLRIFEVWLKSYKPDPASFTHFAFNNFPRWMRGMVFSFIDVTSRNVLLHELGHVVGAVLFFKHAYPTVTIDPFISGSTNYNLKSLTMLGTLVGGKVARATTAALGTSFAMAANLTHLFLVEKVSDEDTKTYLNITTITSVGQHVFYALSAMFGASTVGHDFISLSKVGIHPLLSCAMIVAIPCIAKVGLILLRKKTPRQIPIEEDIV